MWSMLGQSVQAYKPECRKSAELKSFNLTTGETPAQREVVILLDGKGFDWERKHGKKKTRKKARIFGDTWAFDLQTYAWQLPKLLPADNPAAPEGRWKSSTTSIDSGKRLVIFAGDTMTTMDGLRNDLWVLEPQCCPLSAFWRKVVTFNAPPARRGHVFASNESHLIAFGGKTHDAIGGQDAVLSDVWLLPIAALKENAPIGRWTRGADFPRGSFWGSTGEVLVGPSGEALLTVFGGRRINPNATHHSSDPNAYTYFDNVWLYHMSQDFWELVENTDPHPTNRDHHGATVINNQLYIFAGRVKEAQTANADLNDVWAFSVVTRRWTQLYDGNGFGPSRRYMPGVTTSRWNGGDALVIFGGEYLPGKTTKTTMNDLWVFDPQPGGGWVQLSESDCSRAAVMTGRSDVASNLQGPSALTSMLMAMCTGVFLVIFVALSRPVCDLVRKRLTAAREVSCDGTEDTTGFYLMS